jgi:SpoVK/Ycf46/Vps4 family AAA+-type ATPase
MIPPDAGLRPSDTKTKLLQEYVPRNGMRPEKLSLLIYGPPGSSKTTLAKALAKSLGWGMVYLSPTNFITSGEAGIEQKAKDIFEALGVLRDKVIFFDEIDRLILDRDSNAYGEQGDMFQFMTPSMLTKINDLRRAKRCVFIIATNYEEHIDRAIKRRGRIDESIPWLPMDYQSRTELFQTFIDNAFGKMDVPWPEALTQELQKFTKKRALQIYPELKECFKNASKKLVKNGKNLEGFRTELVTYLNNLSSAEIPAGEVSLDSYKIRTSKSAGAKPDDYIQRAYLEYAFLLILKGETAEDDSAKKDFEALLQRWHEQDPEDYEKRQPDVRKRVMAYGLKWMS